MKITIIYLWDDGEFEGFLGAMTRTPSDGEKAEIASRYEARVDDGSDHEEDGRVISFRTVEASESAPAELVTAWEEGT